MERNFLYKTMNNGLYKTMNNGLYKTMNNGFGIIRTDIFHTTNLVYRYQEMGGTLRHRSEGFSPRTFIQPCIQKLFSTFQNYLFHIFYVCFLKGHGEKLFGRVLSKNILWTMHTKIIFNFSNLFIPYILCLFF